MYSFQSASPTHHSSIRQAQHDGPYGDAGIHKAMDRVAAVWTLHAGILLWDKCGRCDTLA